MGANSNIPHGTTVRDGERGTIFYKRATENIVDGGISPTFPDSLRFNTSTTLDISGEIDDCHYIYKADIPTRPAFGDAKFSGLTMRFNVLDLAPGTQHMSGYKGITAYQLRDLPVQKGVTNVTSDSTTNSNTGNYFNDYLVYSDSGANKKLENADPDFIVSFEGIENQNYNVDNITQIGESLFAQTDPFVTWQDVLNDDSIFSGERRSKLDKYVTGDKGRMGPEGGRIYLKRKSMLTLQTRAGRFGLPSMKLKDCWTPRDNRSVFSNEPEWYPKNDSKIRYSGADVARSGDDAGVRINSQPPSFFVPDRFSLIKQTMEAQTFKADYNPEDDNDGSGRDISFARLYTGSKFSMGGHSGCHMNSLWIYNDENLPKYGDETGDNATFGRCSAQFTTVTLPRPIQLDSNLHSSSGGSAMDDIYSFAGRTDVVFKINELPHMMAINDDNLEGIASGRICLERGFWQIWHEQHPTLNSGPSTTSITGHLYDYHTSFTYTDSSNEPATSTSNGLMAIFMGSYQDKVYAIPMASRQADLDAVSHSWQANFAIAKHDNWYEDHASDGVVADQRVMISVPTGIDVITSRNAIELPKGTFIRQTMIIYDPGDKYAVFIYSNATTNELYGVFEVPNGFDDDSSNDADGLSTFNQDWPKYYTASIQNTRFDLPAASDNTITSFTEDDWTRAVGSDGLAYGDNMDSEISVYIDGMYGYGHVSSANNSSTLHENAKSKRPIQIESHDVIGFVAESHRAGLNGLEGGGGGGSTHPAHPFTESSDGMEHGYRICRNTLAIGHQDYPAALGAIHSNDSNEKAILYFNDFKQSNFTNGSIDFGNGTNNIAKDWEGVGSNQTFYNWAGAYSNSDDSNRRQGRQISNQWMTESASDIDTGDITTSGDYFNESFAQKGAIAVDFDDAGTFTKREHILASAKPIKILSNKEMVVLKPELLKVKKGANDTQPTYRIYKYNNQTSASNNLDVKIMEIDYDTGYVKVDTDFSGIMNERQCDQMFIGPIAYWTWYHFWNVDTSENLLANKYYSSMFGFISPTGSPTTIHTNNGFSFNEALLTDSPSLDNLWNIDYEMENSSIVLDKDFGYGKFGDTIDNRKSIQNVGYVQRMSVDSAGVKYMNLKAVVEQDRNLDAGDGVGFAFKSPIQSSTDNYSIQIGTSAHGTATSQPQLFAEYFDKRPEIPDLTVEPYESNPFYPEFKWKTDDGDLWYGLLMVSDTGMVSNQYHDAIMHIPMNNPDKQHGEAVVASDIVNLMRGDVSAGTSPITDATGTFTIDGSPLFDSEGLAGNCIRFADNMIEYEGDTSGSTKTLRDLKTQASYHMHCVFQGGSNNSGDILHSNGNHAVKITLDSTFQITAAVYDNQGSYGDNYCFLKSGILNIDGSTPVAITLVVDTELREGAVKLYINGNLEDQTGVSITDNIGSAAKVWKAGAELYQGFTEKILIGSNSGSGFNFRMEDFVIYKKPIYPINPNNKTLVFTKPITEIDNNSRGARKNYTCRLFMKDYHNIRGSTIEEVAASAPVSLRKTAFRLRGD